MACKYNFIDTLTTRGILADGAMGTEIYRRGVFISCCYDELNLSSPELIQQIHRDYLNAGAQLLTTNTFAANRVALESFGLKNKLEAINARGVELAREVGGDEVFIAGSVGPVSTSASRADVDGNWQEIFAEQIAVLAEAGADVILFETFANLDELIIAIEASKRICDLPVVAQVSIKSFNESGEESFSIDPETAAYRLSGTQADVIGVNCANGPQGVFEVLQRFVKAASKPLSAMPNAGMPRIVHGRTLYLATPEYMANYAKRYFELGVRLIGGCCGTTPDHIREIKKYLLPTSSKKTVESTVLYRGVTEKLGVQPKPLADRSLFGSKLGNKFSISVEVASPLGVDPSKAIIGAKLLKDLGVDAINIADGPRAMPRMSPIALAKIIQQEVGIETIVHYCCRDRNLLGIQMDLLGASALGLNNILLITGDPPKNGLYPDAAGVFDIDSVGLVHFAANLNRGLDFANRSIQSATSLVIGCGCNPGAIDLDFEVEKYAKKVAAGAEFVFSQPVYDVELLDNFLARIKNIKPIPFFIGILPLVSLKNAEFLHNEVPGMQIPSQVMQLFIKEFSQEKQQAIGISVAKEMFNYAKTVPQVAGAYIFPPHGKYELVAQIVGFAQK